MKKRLKKHFIPHEENDYRPHFAREKSVAAIALSAILLFGFVFSLNSVITRNSDLLASVIASVLVDLTNSNRRQVNLHTLQVSETLTKIAQMKADDMAKNSYFSHVSPDGITPWYWFEEVGYNFAYAGENLAVNFNDSEEVVKAWLNSPSHRANMMSDKFSEIGIAIASGNYQGRDSIYVVQMFGRPTQSLDRRVGDESREPVVAFEAHENITGSFAKVDNSEVLGGSNIFMEFGASEVGEARASLVDRALSSPKSALKNIYLVMGVVILAVLIIFVSVEPKRQHPKNFIYLISLVFFLTLLFYLASNHLFSKTLVSSAVLML